MPVTVAPVTPARPLTPALWRPGQARDITRPANSSYLNTACYQFRP